jgi:hypothetical protein
MPIAVTPCLGDLPELVLRERVGVVTDFDDGSSVEQSAKELMALRSDRATLERCRAVARRQFDQPIGVAAYRRLYWEILERSGEAAMDPST